VTTKGFGVFGRGIRVALAAMMLSTAGAGVAMAQDDPNPGALTFTGGFDVPSIYFFRGIRQETDPGLTMWPFADLGIALASGDGGVKSVGVNFGVWNSLHTGSSGSDGPFNLLHYEEDFYATLALGFGGGFSLGTTYTAYTSPNGMFDTVNELSFKVSKAHRFAPYGTIAFELDDEGQADAGLSKGTYLELGVGPSWPIGGAGATLTIPVKLGMSLKDYYEGIDGDETFGFFDVGGLVTLPLGTAGRFGSWNLHGGLDLLILGDRNELANVNADGDTSGSQIVGLVGIGLTY
jgi:hypothetical protein